MIRRNQQSSQIFMEDGVTEAVHINFYFTSKPSVNESGIRFIDKSLAGTSGTTVSQRKVPLESNYENLVLELETIVRESNGGHDQFDFTVVDIFIVHNTKIDIRPVGSRTAKSVNKCSSMCHDTFSLSAVVVHNTIPSFAVLPINEQTQMGLVRGLRVTLDSKLSKKAL
jgi:hypothetical protein